MVDIVVSTSAYLAFNIVNMQGLDRNLGVEALIENANDHCWRRAFEVLLNDRPSQFTIHGPFLFMDLSSKECKFDEVIENYKWTFDWYNKYDAKHVVLHPQGYIDNFCDESRESRQARSIERVGILGDLAQEFNANLLVENLPYPEVLIDQERRIYRAFILGMIFNLISYRKIAEGKYLYRLQLNGIDTEEFVVSNGTPCDHYYEVLDALIINPVVVKTILNYMDKKFTAEKNSAGKITIENSLLMKHIGKLKTDEFKKSGLTIFDLALLLKVSTPAAEFDKKVGKDIMRESLQMIYEYMSTIVLGDDLDWIYGNFVFDQVKAFDKNVDWYFANWRDDFSDYVDDRMQIAANELENKEQENLCEKMQELIENARERRE